ncbi:MAG: type II toxin-antitoxin system prevent-host-death family antitoxin [Azoarcus sp.]|jgi:prevent-host-death family protein|nr:type II toxin-antitoxin system prevent-host-death family antitoxin [Azoarcus sp.]
MLYEEVGIFNAKARLSELLRGVRENGQRYTITVRGESVADLIPSGTAPQKDVHAAIAAMRAIRKVTSDQEIGEWIREGRK